MQLLALTVTWHSSRAFGPPSQLGGAGGTGGGGGFASTTDSTVVATFEMAENVLVPVPPGSNASDRASSSVKVSSAASSRRSLAAVVSEGSPETNAACTFIQLSPVQAGGGDGGDGGGGDGAAMMLTAVTGASTAVTIISKDAKDVARVPSTTVASMALEAVTAVAESDKVTVTLRATLPPEADTATFSKETTTPRAPNHVTKFSRI